MAVPEEIRRVPRPVNTFVVDSKTGVYSVRAKNGCGYYVDADGKRHRPSRNGKVVGHIINGAYVPLDPAGGLPPVGEVDVKDYANIRLCQMLSQDLLEGLRLYYDQKDSEMLYVMAILRACYSGIKDYMLERQMEETFLTELYPAVNLDKSKVSRFLRDVGRSGARIVSFMRDQVNRCPDDDVIVFDGTLKRDKSTVNSDSAASRKTASQNYLHVNVMTAYSTTRREPVASRVYPGNMVDQRIVADFIDMMEIRSGLVVADRGFPPEAVRAALVGRPGIDYLVPLDRDRSLIEELSLRDYRDVLPGTDVMYRVEDGVDEFGGHVRYYSFRDPYYVHVEESLYLVKHSAGVFDPGDFEARRRVFGTIVFASNRDIEPARVREIYAGRWVIETSFKFERSDMGNDTTDEESDYTVQASQFVDHLASIMARRMRNRFEDAGLLGNMTYAQVYSLLLRLKMSRAYGGDWKLVRIADKDARTSLVLGVITEPIVPKLPPKKTGRPKGSRDKVPRKKRGKAAGRGLKDPVSRAC